jgi:hypothetical protein
VSNIFEDVLVRFCAPVLLGKKPAALFPKPVFWEKEFFDKGMPPDIESLTLSRAGRNTLIFVYSPDLLAATLGNPEVRLDLGKLDYPEAGGVEDCLRCLRRRFLTNPEFPHEIGFFLGYPPPDVRGFIRHRGAHCKHCGLWKVYSDVEKACALFREYEWCKQQLLEYIRKGGVLSAGSLSAIPSGA